MPLSPDQLSESYNAIAHQWASPDFNHANGIAQHHRALQFLSCHGGRALDIGCGSSGRFIDLLTAQGFTVEGLDLSPEMIRLAQLQHPSLTFHHADICAWTPPGTYDFITAWDSIWHVPLAAQKDVLTKLLATLSPGGVLIFTTGGLAAPDELENQSMGVPMYYATPGIPEVVRCIDQSGCVLRHLEYDQHPELHVYLIAQRPPP